MALCHFLPERGLARMKFLHPWRGRNFVHIFSVFSGDQYSAGYYSYLWSEVLDHDAFEAFLEAGSPFDKATAKKLQRTIMSVGNSVELEQAYRNFRGPRSENRCISASKRLPRKHKIGRKIFKHRFKLG
jgi:Zn-dependent oligopeptidase